MSFRLGAWVYYPVLLPLLKQKNTVFIKSRVCAINPAGNTQQRWGVARLSWNWRPRVRRKRERNIDFSRISYGCAESNSAHTWAEKNRGDLNLRAPNSRARRVLIAPRSAFRLMPDVCIMRALNLIYYRISRASGWYNFRGGASLIDFRLRSNESRKFSRLFISRG